MKDRAALVFAEHADPLTILHPVVCYDIIVELFSTLDLLWGKGCLIVKVEIARSRGEPLEAPSHLLFERLDLVQGRSGNGHKGRIAGIEVHTAPIECVSPERASKTSFVMRNHRMILDIAYAAVHYVLSFCCQIGLA